MSRKRRHSVDYDVAAKAQKAIDESKQNAATQPATVIDDSRIYKIVIPRVCTGETLCLAIEDALKEPIECVDAYMTYEGQEFYQKVWHSDDCFEARGDVMLQIPIEFRDIILNVVMPSGVISFECKRLDIVDTLLDAQIEQVFQQDGTCLSLDELRFLPNGCTVYVKHNSSI